MSTVTPAVLAAGTTLTTTATAYVTGVASGKSVLKRTVFVNYSASAASINVYRVASGGSFGPASLIIANRSIAAGAADLAPELANMVLGPGDTIQAVASAGSAVNIFSSGFTFV